MGRGRLSGWAEGHIDLAVGAHRHAGRRLQDKEGGHLRPPGGDGQEADAARIGYPPRFRRMNRTLRWTRWTVGATAVLGLFWVAATVGGWSPDIRRLTSSVHGPLVADYRAESPQALAPLSPAITKDASQDQASAGQSRPRPGSTPSGTPTPTASGTGPTPTGSGVLPTLPVPTPTVPVTPTLPAPPPTPSPLPIPTLPTPPPLPS